MSGCNDQLICQEKPSCACMMVTAGGIMPQARLLLLHLSKCDIRPEMYLAAAASERTSRSARRGSQMGFIRVGHAFAVTSLDSSAAALLEEPAHKAHCLSCFYTKRMPYFYIKLHHPYVIHGSDAHKPCCYVKNRNVHCQCNPGRC